MANKYLITFDIDQKTKTGYDTVLNAVAHNYDNDHISSYIRLSSLTTTYAIKSNLSTNQIMKIFCNATNNNIDIIVVKVIDSAWNISAKDANDLKDHKF